MNVCLHKIGTGVDRGSQRGRLGTPAAVVGAVVAGMLAAGEARAGLIALQNATASHSSGTFTPEQSIDGTTTGSNGWAPGSTNVDSDPLIVYETADDAPAGFFQFRFIHRVESVPQHTLARFIISATTDDRDTFADGVVGGDVTANWTELTPVSAFSAVDSGATFTIVGNEVQVTGTNPDTDTYLVGANLTFADVTGFRIATISSTTAPTGPGRATNRNFILTEFQVSVVPEPATAQLMLLGTAVVGRLSRRRRRGIG